VLPYLLQLQMARWHPALLRVQAQTPKWALAVVQVETQGAKSQVR